MNEDYKQNRYNKMNEISLKDLLIKLKVWFHYLLGKWIIILCFGLSGGILGLFVSLNTDPRYTAQMSFALIDNSGTSSLASLASTFGLANFAGGDGGAFSGENLLEIIQSRYAVEQTLLSPVNYKGKKKTLVEVYIEFNEMHKDWQKNKKNPELRKLFYPIGQNRETFTRTQDSVLYKIYNSIVLSEDLLVQRKDKKNGIVNIDFTSEDEFFSQLFVEKLMDVIYQFYMETRTAQSRANIKMMTATADSIKNLYDLSLSRSASISQVNINSANQMAAVPKIKQEANAKLYGSVYAEILANLETLKLDMGRQKPIVQIIDRSRLPLKKERLGKAKAMVIGGFLGGALILLYLLGSLYVKDLLKGDE
ncbi:MAG: lipopolysaccharide biosynthesis protein [Bacteroidia bacterium]|nr:lipopolysaccharide biosynthesis protein [Bacteroidia bacterium]